MSTDTEEFRHAVESEYGQQQHRAHIADDCAAEGDAHSRDYWRGVAAAHRHDAASLATILGVAS